MTMKTMAIVPRLYSKLITVDKVAVTTRLVLGELRLATEPRALGEGSGAAFAGPLQDQDAFELGDARQQGQHQAPARSRGVGPRIVERLEASAFVLDQVAGAVAF